MSRRPSLRLAATNTSTRPWFHRSCHPLDAHERRAAGNSSPVTYHMKVLPHLQDRETLVEPAPAGQRLRASRRGGRHLTDDGKPGCACPADRLDQTKGIPDEEVISITALAAVAVMAFPYRRLRVRFRRRPAPPSTGGGSSGKARTTLTLDAVFLTNGASFWSGNIASPKAKCANKRAVTVYKLRPVPTRRSARTRRSSDSTGPATPGASRRSASP